jgi:hypothetical protein
MERFWRTLRDGCLSHMGAMTTLHDVNVRLWAWVDKHYHAVPHSSLMGRAPGTVYATAEPRDGVDEKTLRLALTARARRRVRRDTTLSMDGKDWELDQGYLAGKVVEVARCMVDPNEPPWVEHEGKRLELHAVDPQRNARRKRPPRREPVEATTSREPVHFDPAGAILDRAAGRAARYKGTKQVSR